jgi:hypothetical protein
VTDEQLRDWLKAAGGTDADVGCFSQALRGRIEALRRVGR